MGCLGQGRAEAVANRLAQHLNGIARTPDARVEAFGNILGTHIAGGADAALEKPGLVVEAMGIQVAVRSLQAHCEAPALAGPHRHMRAFIGIGITSPIPGQRHPRRHAGQGLLDVEGKAYPAFQLLGQAGDHTAHFDVLTFECLRQFVRQTPMGKARRPDEAQAGRAGQQPSTSEKTP